MANQAGRPIAPARKLVAAIMGTIAFFVMAVGLGMSNWAVVIFGLVLLALAIALGVVNVVRRGARAWVVGTAQVTSISPPPTANVVYGRAELVVLVIAPGLHPSEVTIRDPRIPVLKWPEPGDTLPVTVDVDDLRRVRIDWDAVTAADAGADPPPPPIDYSGTDPEAELDDELLGAVEPPPWATRDRQWDRDKDESPAPTEDDNPTLVQDAATGRVVDGELVDDPYAAGQPLPHRAATAPTQHEPDPNATPADTEGPGANDDFAPAPQPGYRGHPAYVDDYPPPPPPASSSARSAGGESLPPHPSSADISRSNRPSPRPTGARPSPHPRGSANATVTVDPETDELALDAETVDHTDASPQHAAPTQRTGRSEESARTSMPRPRRPEPTQSAASAAPVPMTTPPAAPAPISPPPTAPQAVAAQPVAPESAPEQPATEQAGAKKSAPEQPAAEQSEAYDDIDLPLDDAPAESVGSRAESLSPPAEEPGTTLDGVSTSSVGVASSPRPATPWSTRFVANAAHEAAPPPPKATPLTPKAAPPASADALPATGPSQQPRHAAPEPSTGQAPVTPPLATISPTLQPEPVPSAPAELPRGQGNAWADLPTMPGTPEQTDELITAYPSARPVPASAIHGVGVTVLVTNLKRSVAFYCEILGFYEIDSGDDSAVLASGDTRLVLRTVQNLSAEAGRLIYLNLEVGDVEAIYQELTARGVAFVHAPRAVNRGNRLELLSATFRDPDDHNIAITQWRAIR